MTKSIRVVICDDHSVVRYGITHLLSNEPGIEVSGQAASGSELLKVLEKTPFDVIIIDMELGDYQGTEIIEQIKHLNADAKIIVYSAHSDETLIYRAIELGVQGYILKQSDYTELTRAIQTIYQGGSLLESSIATKLLRFMRSNQDGANSDSLSRREIEVLMLLASGKSNRTIADSLFISERTVKFHVSSILAKLQAKNRTEAALLATEKGLIKQRPLAER